MAFNRSIIILALAMDLLLKDSRSVNCSLSRKDGMFKETPEGKMSNKSKPLSARIRSAGDICCKKFDFKMIDLSDSDPPNNSLTNTGTPFGAQPIVKFS